MMLSLEEIKKDVYEKIDQGDVSLKGIYSIKNLSEIFYISFRDQNYHICKRLLEMNLVDLDDNFYKSLVASIEKNLEDLIFLMIEQSGIDINKSVSGKSIVHHVLGQVRKHNTIDSLKKLLTLGVDLNIPSNMGMTPIMSARSVEVITILVEHGANINYVSEHYTVLHNAASYYSMECYYALLDLKPNLSVLRHGLSAIQEAALACKLDKVTALVEYGVNIDGHEKNPITPREIFLKKFPERIAEFDAAVQKGCNTLKCNKEILCHQLFYTFQLACNEKGNFQLLPFDVTGIIAEYIGFYGKRFDTKEAAFLLAVKYKRNTDNFDVLPQSDRKKHKEQIDNNDDIVSNKLEQNIDDSVSLVQVLESILQTNNVELLESLTPWSPEYDYPISLVQILESILQTNSVELLESLIIRVGANRLMDLGIEMNDYPIFVEALDNLENNRNNNENPGYGTGLILEDVNYMRQAMDDLGW